MSKIQVTKKYIQIVADNCDAGFLRLISEVSGIYPVRAKDTYRCSLQKLPEVLKSLRGIESSEQLPLPIKEIYDAEILRRRATEEIMTGGWLDEV